MQLNEISFLFDEDSDDNSYHTYCLESEMRTEQELNCSLNRQSKSKLEDEIDSRFKKTSIFFRMTLNTSMSLTQAA